MRVGVLAVQGGFAAHLRALVDVGCEAVSVRRPVDLEGLDGLILPGGESTTHLQLIERFGLQPGLDAFAASGRPMLVTCAGLILAAARVTDPAQPSFGWLDVDVARNAWGRQVHSFQAVADDSDLPLLFIRAPRITRIGEGVEVTARFKGEPVMVRRGRLVGAAFHPELTHDRRVHRALFGGGQGWLLRPPTLNS